MNRRTLLRTAGVAATVGLSGCLEALQEHYQGSFQGLVPIEIHSEADRHFDLTLEAYEPGTNRQTYDESYTVTANQSASPPHLEATEQNFRVVKYGREGDEETFRETTITPSTKFVNIRITNDDLILDVDRGTETEANDPNATASPTTAESGSNGTEPIDGNGESSDTDTAD
ncbi:hypothetical protein [Natrinema longum]|uniref:Uncharacterized protein n=1 Tax=Natrinema longum TaxID=370324 RepID=A0A8A2UA38_9EURY|nr:hypothetical protein [Natrinema longum]MBZ6496557.1 hypothetical protein [Natrinema longum]QSW85540.1 hypothetical protein J0X27_01470 [Natrinema longum]